MHRDLDELFGSVRPGETPFSASAQTRHLPALARRYFEHAIAEGTPVARAVRLHMHGEIKLGEWWPFEAEQVIRVDHAMIWRAKVRMKGLPVTGFDRLVDGEAAMRWKMLGVVPVMRADGPEIVRSAAGRVAAESMWLPSSLLDAGPSGDVRWTEENADHAHVRICIASEHADVRFGLADDGALRDVSLSRWGNPERADFHYEAFGGEILDEGTFGGHTIPTRVRVGWYYGTPRFESEGEFFRATVDDATFR